MGRPKQNEKVVKFLELSAQEAANCQSKCANAEEYQKADIYKSFRDILIRALELCEDKKESQEKKETNE